MRKRSAYRPKKNLQDPLNWVLGGMQPVAIASEPITIARIKNHAAICSIRSGTACFNDVDVLLTAFNITEALAKLGQGVDWLPEIIAAQDALRQAGERPKYGFTGPEMTAVNLAMDIHDAQLDDPGTTVAMLEKALKVVIKAVREKKVRPVKFQPETCTC